MVVSMIAAVAENGVIGRDGRLPWHIPAELARFKELTMGHTLIMGRKTFESIGRPLPGRRTIVLTRSGQTPEGCLAAGSLTDALRLAQGEEEEEVFICGGGQVFAEAIEICQRIYLTRVKGVFEGDTYFPEIPEIFLQLSREDVAGAVPPCTLMVYERVEPTQPETAADELRQKGLAALQRGLHHLARRCLEQAAALQETPEISSHLAFCIAKSCGDFPLALRLAEEAMAREPENLTHYLNLGRVQILGGLKQSGLITLRAGLRMGGGREFMEELERHGTRKPPVIPFMSRNHPVNKYLGILLHRVGLR